MTVRLGDLLVKQGVLTHAQRDRIVEVQLTSGRPFGELAEALFGVSPEAVEAAWATQYGMLAPRVDPRRYSPTPDALALINRRQAWQFGVLPLEFDERELVICTTEFHLVRALKFVGWKIPSPCYFVLSEPAALGECLDIHYPMAGMSGDDLVQATRLRRAC